PSGWLRPRGMTILRPAEPAFVRLRMMEHCALLKIKDKKPVLAHPEAWVVPGVMACPGPIRQVGVLLPGPTLDAKGRLINRQGYDETTRNFLAREMIELAIPTYPQRECAIEAAGILGALVADFPFESEVDRSRWLCLLLAACCRHLIGRTPLGL